MERPLCQAGWAGGRRQWDFHSYQQTHSAPRLHVRPSPGYTPRRGVVWGKRGAKEGALSPSWSPQAPGRQVHSASPSLRQEGSSCRPRALELWLRGGTWCSVLLPPAAHGRRPVGRATHGRSLVRCVERVWPAGLGRVVGFAGHTAAGVIQIDDPPYKQTAFLNSKWGE